ncbi:MAG: DUF1476 domain-containing protein [Alphaproteobacteria bacterium]|nr:DUF1476 domain-containing protein [Alphaproteobacteria bacterium]
MTLDNRKKAMESKYAHDEKLGFEIEARGCKLFGLWAAGQLGLEGEEAKVYAASVVEVNLDEPGFDDVLRKISNDFDQKGVEATAHTLHTELDKALQLAKAQKMIEEKE